MDDHDVRAIGCAEQWCAAAGRQGAFAGRDRIAVRIVARPAEFVGERIDIFGGEMVLRLVGAAVPLVAGHAGLVREPGFVDAVGADDAEGLVASGCGELRAGRG